MYIRKSTRIYKGKTYCNYLLVESVLTPKGPRQRTICSLGNLAPGPPEEWRALAHGRRSWTPIIPSSVAYCGSCPGVVSNGNRGDGRHRRVEQVSTEGEILDTHYQLSIRISISAHVGGVAA